MKQLTCEMCGGTDLMKQDGVFVCQSCGTKYSVEEAKKMMIEGTVEVTGKIQVDSSERLANLYQIARRARDEGISENAAKYYDMILVEDPTSWEASFYVVYFKAASCKIAEIRSAANSVANCLESVFKLIRNNVSNVTDQFIAVSEVTKRSFNICEALYKAAINHQNEISHDIAYKYYQECANRTLAATNILYTLGDQIDEIFNDNNEFHALSVDAWNLGITCHSGSFVKMCYSAKQLDNMKQTIDYYENKIGKYDSSRTKNKLKDIENQLSAIPEDKSYSWWAFLGFLLMGASLMGLGFILEATSKKDVTLAVVMIFSGIFSVIYSFFGGRVEAKKLNEKNRVKREELEKKKKEFIKFQKENTSKK